MRRYVKPRPQPKKGGKNKTEQAYEDHLKLLYLAREIQDYRFEGLKLRLAKSTFYTPDFFVIRDDCIELHEVKGHWEDDARVKIKVAAEQFPWFKFVAVQAKGKSWSYEYF
jgi:hypothetical protein